MKGEKENLFGEPCPYMDKDGNRGPENKPLEKRRKNMCKRSLYYYEGTL